jgi:C_GCAxxG_C_C family probable redox protein
MTREEKAETFFKEGYNCAQAVFCAFAEDFGIDLALAKRLSCGLGGGVGRQREVCGAVTGAVLVLGLRHGEDKAVVYPRVQAFCAAFAREAGSIVCRTLLEGTGATSGGAPAARSAAYYQKRPCVELVKLAVRLLEEPGA